MMEMPPLRRIGRAILTGAIAGALVLGAGGRLAMRAIALAAGLPVGFSLGGTAEVILTGALVGATGGVLALAVTRLRPVWARGVVVGLVLFAGVALTSPAARGAAAGVPRQLDLALTLFGALFLGYGTLVQWVVTRQARRSGSVPEVAP